MWIKILISVLTLIVTSLVMTLSYHGELSFVFFSKFYEAQNSMKFPFLIHFLFVSHFILATVYFFHFRKNFILNDFKRFFFAVSLGTASYGTYCNLNSHFEKEFFSLIRHMMGYFHIFVDELKLFSRLIKRELRFFFLICFSSLLSIFAVSSLTLFSTHSFFKSLVLFFLISLFLTIIYIQRKKNKSSFLSALKSIQYSKIFPSENIKTHTPYLIFILFFFFIPCFFIKSSSTFEKLGIFYFCYHVIQCYFYYPINLFVSGGKRLLKPLLVFITVVFLIHGSYFGVGLFGIHVGKIQPYLSQFSWSDFFSYNFSVQLKSFLDFPYFILFDAKAYQFWGVFHITHCFFYDRLKLQSFLEIK